MLTYEANELEGTIDILTHNNTHPSHQLFTIEADLCAASDHIDRDRYGRAKRRTVNLKSQACQLHARAVALSR